MVSPIGPASSVLLRLQRQIREYRHQLLGLPTLLLDVPLTTASDDCPRPSPLLTQSGDARHSAG